LTKSPFTNHCDYLCPLNLQGERFFEIFLDIYVILHALFLVFFVGLVVSIAWFFGYTGAYPLLALGLILLPVAWLASQGEADGEGSLVLP
jgi:hypothetical protein